MLELHSNAGMIPLKVDDYYIREISSGLTELCFTISIWDDDYTLIQEESRITENTYRRQHYIVKAIDGGGETATVKCQIDLDEWKATMTVPYNSGSNTVHDIVTSVAPTGWRVIDNSGMTISRTVSLDYATPLDVLDGCRSAFIGVSFIFDNNLKTVEIVDVDGGQETGAFVTRDINLRQLNYRGKSSGFATRLYAYGKEGLSFADINGGKPYVENYSYSSRVICAYWSDERYAVKENLLHDAQERLNAIAVPQESYSCDVVDLAAADPTKFSYLSFPMFSVVALVDKTRSSIPIKHKVAERWTYPNMPEKNKVILSTAAPRIQGQATRILQYFPGRGEIQY